MNVNTTNRHKPREYSTITTDKCIALCDKEEGIFLVLRFPEDVERLKELLNSIEIGKRFT